MSMIPLPPWRPINCPDTIETVTAAGYTAAIGYELSDPRKNPAPRVAWWIHSSPPLPQPALCNEILAEGTADTLGEARAQAEDALRRVLHERADEIRERAETLTAAAEDFRYYARALAA